ncbi:sigma-70 family RNA polymerase sigma factor [Alphaproteobacteria bacterium]|nr:sigma-70 family RNA polymerase sigma factor [Alphaproteobacteria bacterium]
MVGIVLRQPRLSRVEEQELFRRLHLGDRAAATKLVTSHLRFVLHIAKRYSNHGQPLADLIQEGTVGLLEAVKRFNPDRDVQLSTYAMWWIRASIQDYVVRSRSLVKIGTTAAQKSLFFNLRRRIGEIVDGEGPSEDFARGLSERFNTSVVEVVNFARRMARPDLSLDATFPDGGSRSPIIERLQDKTPTPEEALLADTEGRIWLEWLSRALSGLPPRELLIIRRRFLTDKAPSRAALGVELGLSKERVRQLEVRALTKLQTILQPLRDHAELAIRPFSFTEN